MKSKIKFDVVPFSGKPGILISCQYSDDIRDKIVMNFINDVQSKDCKLIMVPDEHSIQEIGELRFFVTTE